MKRVPITELLDSDAGTHEEVVANLVDLQRINRWFGGQRTAQALVEKVANTLGTQRLSLLEVAAGASGVPESVADRLQRKGLTLDVTLLDRRHSHLLLPTRSVVGDALSLPCRNESFDLVSCNLFVHHLDPLQLVQFVNEALRVSTKAVLINDLIRHPLHLILAYGGFLFYRSRLSRHDAPASVRQAYTPTEMQGMLQRTSGAHVEMARHYLFRMTAIVWKTWPPKAYA
jgi:ubiquinone/menaquinone biosynthesis C-methylase UbiE